MKVFDQSGKAVEVPDDQVGAALSTGKYGVLKDTRVPVKYDGQIGTIDASELHQTLQNGGEVVSQQDYDHHVEEEKYTDVGHKAAAVGLGAVRGLTLGGSDVAASALGQDAKDYVRKTKEYNPYTSTAAEIGGSLLPAAFSGGGSEVATAGNLAREGLEGVEAAKALAGGAEAAEAARSATSVASHLGDVAKTAIGAPVKLLGAPLEATNEVGNLVQKGVAKIVGDQATSLAGKIAQKGAQLAARSAVEGAIMGGGQEIGEEALGDPELNGQKILASIGHGALLGLGGGAALGAAGELGSAALGRVASHLSGAAEEQAVRSLSVSSDLKAFRKINDLPGGVQGLGRQLLDDGVIKAGETVDEVAPRIAEAKEAAGKAITDRLSGLDSAAAEGPSLGNVNRELEEKVIPRLKKFSALTGNAEPMLRKLQDNLSEIAGVPSRQATIEEAMSRVAQTTDAANPAYQDILKKETKAALLQREESLKNARFTFEEAHKARQTVDSYIKEFGAVNGVESESQRVLKDVRFSLEREIESAGDVAAKKVGGSFLDEYKQDKLTFRRYAEADKLAQKAVDKRASNRVFSPSDHGVGAVGAIIGGEGGHGILGGIAGLATGVAHHFIRERGNSTAAVALDKLSALGGIKRASEAVDREIDRGVARAVGRTDRVVPRTRQVEGDYAEKSEAVIKAASNPDAHADDIERAAGPIAAHAPQVAASFQRAALRATMYLAGQLPKSTTSRDGSHVDADDADKERWESLYDVVHDPSVAVAAIADGSITTEQVDALKKTHPDVYAETAQKLTHELATTKGDLSLEQINSIGTFLGQPVDAVTSPYFMAYVQGNYGAGAKKAPTGKGTGSRGGAPKRKLDMVNPYKLNDKDT